MTFFTPKPPSLPVFRAHQYGGATLLFVLIMLLVVSIIGVAAARSTLMQERMASNTDIRNVVFEAAESALAMGEIRVANTPGIWKPLAVANIGTCEDGICAPSTLIVPEWLDAGFWTDSKNYKEAKKIELDNGLEITPKYMIEDLGQTMAVCDTNHIDVTNSPDCPYTSAQRFFRVAAFAKAHNTQVLLQSMYLDPNPIRSDLEPPGDWSGADTRPECNGKKYSPGNQECCPPDKDHPGPNRWLTDPGVTTCPAYCVTSGLKYNPREEQCCMDANGVESITAKGACPQLCGQAWGSSSKIPYTPGQQTCCREKDGSPRVVAGTQGCPQYCGNTEYDPNNYQGCCGKSLPGGNIVYNNRPGSGEKCCDDDSGIYVAAQCRDWCPTANGRVEYDKATQECCDNPAGKSGKQIVNGKTCPSYCPGSGTPYDPQTQTCCGGVPVAKGTDCCGSQSSGGTFPGRVYDRNNQTCCASTVLINKPEECCKDDKTNAWIGALPGACPKYCGSGAHAIALPQGMNCCGGQTRDPKIYDMNTDMCCFNTRVVSKSQWGACPLTCNGQEYDPSKQQCCQHPGSQPDFLRDKGNCPVFCNDMTADNFGEEGPCQGGNRGGGGPNG